MTKRKKTFLIGAVSSDGIYGIGKRDQGKIPLNSRRDMEFFRERTIGNDVAMTRGMWMSLPPRNKPLPRRGNIIVTSVSDLEIPKVHLASSIHVVDSVSKAKDISTADELYYAGGEVMWEMARQYVDELLINVICLPKQELIQPGDSEEFVYFHHLLDPCVLWPEFVLLERYTEIETINPTREFTIEFRRYVRVQRELF